MMLQLDNQSYCCVVRRLNLSYLKRLALITLVLFSLHWPTALGRFSLRVAVSVCVLSCVCCHAVKCNFWRARALIGPEITWSERSELL